MYQSLLHFHYPCGHLHARRRHINRSWPQLAACGCYRRQQCLPFAKLQSSLFFGLCSTLSSILRVGFALRRGRHSMAGGTLLRRSKCFAGPSCSSRRLLKLARRIVQALLNRVYGTRRKLRGRGELAAVFAPIMMFIVELAVLACLACPITALQPGLALHNVRIRWDLFIFVTWIVARGWPDDLATGIARFRIHLLYAICSAMPLSVAILEQSVQSADGYHGTIRIARQRYRICRRDSCSRGHTPVSSYQVALPRFQTCLTAGDAFFLARC